MILAEEDNPPTGHQAVRWLLVTSLPVSSLEDALRCLHWYSYRWLIERFHFVLKSGCRFEDLQLENAERLKRALASYLIVAWRLLWLTYEARRQPEQPCSEVLENVSSDLRESEQVILSAHTRCRHTTYELALLSIIL